MATNGITVKGLKEYIDKKIVECEEKQVDPSIAMVSCVIPFGTTSVYSFFDAANDLWILSGGLVSQEDFLDEE